MLDTLLSNAWLVAAIWAVLYVIDYRSTLWLQDVYRVTLNQYVVYEGGVELNPNFEKEIALQRELEVEAEVEQLVVQASDGIVEDQADELR